MSFLVLFMIALLVVTFLRLGRIEKRLDFLERRTTDVGFQGAQSKMEQKTERLEFVQSTVPEQPLVLGAKGTKQMRSEEYPEIVFTPREAEIADPSLGEKQPQAVQKESTTTSSERQDMEFRLGGKIFTVVGALASIIGISFFLRYAFENDLISESVRCILGLIFGALLLLVGEFTRKKFNAYSQIITGSGIGIFYLSVYSAYGYYQLISHSLAFTAMILITTIGITLAVRYNSLLLAVFSQIGGFLTPELLASGQNAPHTLFLYLTLLNLGIAVIAWHKLWRSLVLVNFFGTLLVYVRWFFEFYNDEQFLLAQGYATLFFLIFLGITLIHYHIRKAIQNASDYLLLVSNAGFYFLISYVLIDSLHHEFMGFFTLSLSLLYLSLALLVNRREGASVRFSRFSGSVGTVLLTLAIPIQLDGNWVTIGWSFEALALVYVGFLLKSVTLRSFAMGLFLLSFLRLTFFDLSLAPGAVAFFNERVLTFMLALVSFALATELYRRKQTETTSGESTNLSFLALIGCLGFLLGGTVEILDFFSRHWLVCYWLFAVLGLTLVGFAIKDRAVRFLALIVFLVSLARLLFFEIELDSAAPALLNVRFSVFSFSLLVMAVVFWLYRAWGERVHQGELLLASRVLSIGIYLALISLVSAEIVDFHSQHWLPVAWSLIAFLAVVISWKLQNGSLRLVAYLGLVVTFFYLLTSESQVELEKYWPFFNSRVGTFFFSVGIFGTILFLFKKKASSEWERKLVSAGLFLSINFLLIWLLSVELLDFFRQRFINLPEDLQFSQRLRYENLKNVSLSVGWTIYSIVILILGIIKKSAALRRMAISLLLLVIFKVFLLDTASLSTLYKFISFITLGIILLLAGFLYNQYKDRISQFIRD